MEPYQIIKELEAKGFCGTIDRLKHGLITLRQAEDEVNGGVPDFVMPEPICAEKEAARMKREGIDRKESWTRWIQRTSLRPGMNAKKWYAIYDSV